ncbi:XrtA system polysaccharide deacetylase [Thiohalomonas denitrificans]|uniref:Polysaccharide deacetylase family protein, PEP-CTERM locus subfamily n=1 Tax=Thiohalomonas denitrificans TaxID=415747 RepID=A0A1G5Q2V5_9GAMM|nr:XrtA system polysaccharide deacetylase [Thiohalomonas denitrificans]SCZ55958.1 polysaccharide deacetylase family protein, PEP-CTERM locus subfamily [Thiohalomonas denitrificans]
MVKERPSNALSVDVEDYFHVSAFRHSVTRADWEKLPPRVEQNTDRLIGLFEHHSVKATFFVLGWVAEKYPNLVRRIVDNGHEVACHGYSHALIYQQNRATFFQETVRAKAILEEQAQQPVIGYRAASWSVTAESLWALDILSEVGFQYDSSIFPVRRDIYGVPDSPRDIHQRKTSSGLLTEFPPATVPMFGRNLPVGGGGYFRLYPYAFTRAALRRAGKIGTRRFIFYIHPWEIDTEQPRLAAGLKSRFRHYLNLSRCERRLGRLLSDFRFDTARNVLTELGYLDIPGKTSMVTSYDAVAREQQTTARTNRLKKTAEPLQARAGLRGERG